MNNKVENRKSLMVLPLAVIVTLLWGSAFPAIKISYELLGFIAASEKIWFAGIRFFLAGAMVYGFGCIGSRKVFLPQKKEYKPILLLGLVQTILQYSCFYLGLAYVSGAEGSIIYSSNSFIAIFFAHLFCKNDRISLRKLTGCAIGMTGVILINWGTEDV